MFLNGLICVEISRYSILLLGINVGFYYFQILCIVFAIWIVKDSSKINPVD